MFDQFCPDGISMDIPEQLQQIAVTINKDRFIPTFKDLPFTFIVYIKQLSINSI